LLQVAVVAATIQIQAAAVLVVFHIIQQNLLLLELTQ
jgi:hypothetical protein